MKLWIRLAHGERGANLVEYGILAVLIAVATAIAVRFFGGSTNELFEQMGSNM